MLVIVAIIHLLPVSGAFSSDWAAKLYGIEIQDRNLAILMRHRSILFALLGSFLLAASFIPNWQIMAIAAGSISVVSFLLLAWHEGQYNAAIQRVILADWIALLCLVIALSARLLVERS